MTAEPVTVAQKSLVTARNLSMRFPVKSKWVDRVLKRQPQRYLHAVNALNLTIPSGKTMSLVSESGCGKSTVARCAAGLYKPTSGFFFFRGKNMSDIAKKSLPERREVQMIFQDPYELRKTKMMPLRTSRSSTRGTPWDKGKYGSIRRICASDAKRAHVQSFDGNFIVCN